MTRLLPLLLLALAACATPPGADDAVPYDPTAPLPEASLYGVASAWRSDAGEPAALADFRGRPVLVAMVYAQCGTACPFIVRDMRRIGEAAGVPGLQYVLVSLDPERDSPEQLRAFRASHDLGDEWTLLRGEADDVQTLAALLGVRYRPDPDGTIAHTNRITLLDADGAIVVRQDGLGTDPGPAADALRAL